MSVSTMQNNYNEARSALETFIDHGFPETAAELCALRQEHDRLEKKVTRLFHEADWWRREYKEEPTEDTLNSMNAAMETYRQADEKCQAMWESWDAQLKAYEARKATKRSELEEAVMDAEYTLLLSENSLTETC